VSAFIWRNTIVTQSQKNIPSEALLKLVEKSLDDNKAQALTVIDLAGKSTIADYMVIVTGTSSRQISAMADYLVQDLKAAGYENIIVDGQSQGDWVLVDIGDIIVHLFRPEVREFYNLEKMWDGDMPHVEATLHA